MLSFLCCSSILWKSRDSIPIWQNFANAQTMQLMQTPTCSHFPISRRRSWKAGTMRPSAVGPTFSSKFLIMLSNTHSWYIRTVAKVCRSPVKRTKFVWEGGVFRESHTLGFKWCFVYTLVWELKPEVRTFVCFGGRGREGGGRGRDGEGGGGMGREGVTVQPATTLDMSQ